MKLLNEAMPQLIYNGKVSDSYFHSQPFINLTGACQNIISLQITVYKNAQTQLDNTLAKLEAKIKEASD